MVYSIVSRFNGIVLLFFFNLATRAGSPQQRQPITVGPYYLATLSTFPVGGNRSTRRKPTTFGRALTILLLMRAKTLRFLEDLLTRIQKFSRIKY